MDLPGFLPLKLDLPDILPRLFPGLDPQYSFLAVFVTAAVGLPALLLWMFLKIMAEDDWDPKDKHCIVTGGSSGLGLSLAELLLSRGAHVTIIARNQSRLDTALDSLKANAGPSSKVFAVSADMSTGESARQGIKDALVPFGGKMADAVFMAAGGSTPGFFLEQPDSVLTSSMATDYWTACFTAKASATLMAAQRPPSSSPSLSPPGPSPKLVFVASTLAYMSFAGYSSYSPAKHAIRGLADTLRSELILYGIDVHCFFPAGILSPGFEQEEKCKPGLTKTIEGSDSPGSPEVVARELLKGVEKNQKHISYDIATNIFRNTTRGMAPYNNVLADLLYGFIGSFGVPIWRTWADSKVREHRAEHLQRLVDEGFFDKHH